MCNCFSANNTTNSVFVVVSSCYCYCQLYSYIVKHTHTHTHNTYSAVYCMLLIFLVGVSIQLANIAARGAFAIETEDVLDIEQCVGVGGGMWQLWQLRHNCGLTGS